MPTPTAEPGSFAEACAAAAEDFVPISSAAADYIASVLAGGLGTIGEGDLLGDLARAALERLPAGHEREPALLQWAAVLRAMVEARTNLDAGDPMPMVTAIAPLEHVLGPLSECAIGVLPTVPGADRVQ